MPKKRSKLPKPYGRQADGKTIKSLSLDATLVKWAENKAAGEGMSFSAWMNSLLATKKGKGGKAAKGGKKKK